MEKRIEPQVNQFLSSLASETSVPEPPFSLAEIRSEEEKRRELLASNKTFDDISHVDDGTTRDGIFSLA